VIPYWAQADLDRNFAAVFALPQQLKTGSHRTCRRSSRVLRALLTMLTTQSKGNQHVDRTSDQFARLIAEQAIR
jgi:hypothetical protein